MFSFDVVPGKVVKDILDTSPARVIEIVEDTYRRHDAGRTVNPDSYFLRFPRRPEARIIALPAFAELPGAAVAGIKWISSFPSNTARGIPRASAVLILNDYATGHPLALLEAAAISAARTAASAAVAARALTQHITPGGRVAVIGAGVIARTIVRYLTYTYPIDELVVFDLDPASAESLAGYARELGIEAGTASTIEDALDAQTVITATTAARPHIARPLRAGQVVLNISLRDFTPEVVLRTVNYVDDVEHCLKAGTSPHLAEQLSGNRDFVTGTLADVLCGRSTPTPGRGVMFSPFGLGVLDLAVGMHVLTVARQQGLTTEIPDFFGETSRW